MKLLDHYIGVRDNLKYVQETLRETVDQKTFTELEEKHKRLLVDVIGRTWFWKIENPREEQKQQMMRLREMRDLIRESIPLFGKKGWPFRLRVCACLCRWDNRAMLYLAWFFNQVDRIFRREKLY